MLHYIYRLTLPAVLLISLAFLYSPPNTDASSATGIDIEAGEFKFRISFGLQYYRPGDLDYIKNPSGLLFDLITLFQKNFEPLSKKDMNVWIDIIGYNDEKEWKDPEKHSYLSVQIIQGETNCKAYDDCVNGVSWWIPFRKLGNELLERQVCAVLPIMDCALGPKALGSKTIIYVSDSEELLNNVKMIRFGALPGHRYAPYPFLKPLNGREKEFKKVSLKRSEMEKHFDPLFE